MPDYDADFFTDEDQRLARSSTHRADQPNPATPYLNKLNDYLSTLARFTTGGLQGAGALQNAPDWVQQNPVQGALQNPDNQAALEIFGGITAKGADLGAWRQAKRMAEGGSSAEDIWKQTGWSQGKDKQWRFEIPDVKSAWVKEPAYGSKSSSTMKDVLNHPELYAAYPDIGDMPAYRMHPRNRLTGVYNPPGSDAPREAIGINTAYDEDERTIALHELQHAVQEREGFDPGGMPNVNRSSPMYSESSPDELYMRSAGETEARNVEARKDMTRRQLKANPPQKTEDIPRSWQILDQPDLVGTMARYLGALGR